MILKDEGLVVYVKTIKENHLFIKILSKKNGLCLGTVYGGNSKKNKNIYQLGNFIIFNLINKNKSPYSTINGDIKPPLVSFIFNDKYKLHALLTCCSLINCSVNEGQKFEKIYLNCIDLFNSFIKNHWFSSFSNWLLLFISELGYGFDLTNISSDTKYINTDNFEFCNKNIINSSNKEKFIEFPYELIINKLISYKQCQLLFNIFEFIMIKHLLNQSNKKIPNIYFTFKELILNNIRK